MDILQRHFYKPNNRLLSLVGLWPYQDKKSRLFRLYFLNVALMSFNLTQVIVGIIFFLEEKRKNNNNNDKTKKGI